MEFYIVYDANTGEERSRGQGPEHSAALQNTMLPEGLTTMVVTLPVFNSYPLNLEQVRADIAAKIDSAAEAVRMRFLTTGAGQAITYTAKIDEAKAFLADPASPTPFLTAEATAIGVSVDSLAKEVLAKQAEWTVVGSRIEGARMGAKAQLGKATNLAEIASAAQVDWATVVA